MLVRLKKNYEFARVFRHGKRYVGKDISIHYRRNTLDHNRYGFTTRKHFGNAVTRNHMRRLMREALRSLAPFLSTGYDIILMGRRLDAHTNYHAIRAELKTQLLRAKILSDNNGES